MHATESLPDQAMTKHNQAAGSACEADAADDKQQKKTANPQEKKRRSTRPQAAADVVMLDAVVSDSEQEEEETAGSDADFMTIPKGSKKVRLSISQPCICQDSNNQDLMHVALSLLV